MEATSVTAALPHAVPLREQAGYPSFLSGDIREEGLLLNEPLGELRSLRRLDRFTPDHRQALAAAITEHLVRWDAPAPALESAATLRDPGSYAVVTGQQAGIAGGPLYTLYKAIGAVRAAQELSRLHPEHRFVPVFWIEGDDHDFDEARKIVLLDRSGSPQSLSYDDGVSAPLHVGDRPNSEPGVAALVASLREILPPTEFTDQAISLVTGSYRNGERLADGFARALYAIFGETPLVLVDSRNPALKRLAADLFAKEAADPAPLFDAVRERTAVLADAGQPTPISPKQGALFITHEGERRSLVADENGYTIKGTQTHMSRDEAAALAGRSPEIFSPNVALRPIVQDAILPTAIYLGGPSEVAYLRQIRDGYGAFGMEPSAVMPRPFVLLLEPKVRRVLDGGDLSLEELLAEQFDAAAHAVDGALLDEVEEGRERALEGLRRAYAEMESVTKRIDPTLEKTLGAAAAGAAKGVEDLAKRLGSALKKKQQTEIDRLAGARTMLMPGGSLQERVLNPLYFVDKYGLERFREALRGIALQPGMMQVVEL